MNLPQFLILSAAWLSIGILTTLNYQKMEGRKHSLELMRPDGIKTNCKIINGVFNCGGSIAEVLTEFDNIEKTSWNDSICNGHDGTCCQSYGYGKVKLLSKEECENPDRFKEASVSGDVPSEINMTSVTVYGPCCNDNIKSDCQECIKEEN